MKKLIYRLFLAAGIIASSLGFTPNSANATIANPSDVPSMNIVEQKTTTTDNLNFSDVIDQQQASGGMLLSGHYSHSSHSSHSSHHSHYSSRY